MMAGRLELIIGPMFAGKTTEMLRRIDRAALSGHSCLLIKYQKDNDTDIDTNNSHESWSHSTLECRELMPNIRECLNYHTIGIDEGHFFEDICQFCKILANVGKRIIVAALDGTYRREPFENVLKLVANCESVDKLSAVCIDTGKEAAFSRRTINSNDTHLVGGIESYVAVSRNAYFHLENAGKIELTIGPIRCGKSRYLIRQLQTHANAGRNVLLFRPSEDQYPVPEQIEVRNVDQMPLVSDLQQYDVIGIDDVHEFIDIAEWADSLANAGKIVMLSGVDSDAHQNTFPEIMKIIPYCEKIEKLDSICPLTGLPAPFTYVIGEGHLTPISRLGIISHYSLANAGIF